MYNELKKLINCFNSEDAKRFWIAKLNVCDSIKGYLTFYFNL